MKRFYTWQEFDKDIEKIVAWARDKNFKSIYGVPRGGLIVAVTLAHHLDLPLKLWIEEIDQDTLAVDDISDSGSTLLALEQKLAKRPTIAALFYRKDTKRMPDFTLHEKKEWIVFPWETEKSSRRDKTLI